MEIPPLARSPFNRVQSGLAFLLTFSGADQGHRRRKSRGGLAAGP